MRLSRISCGTTTLQAPGSLERTFRSFEPKTSEVVTEVVKAGHRFIDVGANFGYFSVLASQSLGPSGQVAAVETSPATHELLLEDLTLGCASSFLLVPTAVGNRDALIDFQLTDDVVSSGRAGSPFEETTTNIRVRQQTFDARFGSQTVDQIKIDPMICLKEIDCHERSSGHSEIINCFNSLPFFSHH